MGKKKDSTAQGVAKLRHIETLFNEPGKKQLFVDPYAQKMYPGSGIVNCLGWKGIKCLMKGMGAGLLHMLIGRTKWLDDVWMKAVEDGITQVVILGAGYDMRGYRLDLPDNVHVFEVDQPEVQALKKAKIAKCGVFPKRNLHFVAIDFNQSTLEDLAKAEGFDPNARTLFTMEGLTQYIPRDATQQTVQIAAKSCGPGSRLAISYVDQYVFDDPNKVSPNDAKSVNKLLRQVEKVGEPWITGWYKEDLAQFLTANGGFSVTSDITVPELNEMYFIPAGREISPDWTYCLERYAVGVKE